MQITKSSPQRADAGALADTGWRDARERLLAAIDRRQRPAVENLIGQRHGDGVGLRMWLRVLASQRRPLPRSLPAVLIEVYLNDPEALPLHDCARCGLTVPIRPSRFAYDAEPQRVYFPECPVCTGPTGLYAYW